MKWFPAKFQYTFFDAFGLNNSVPEMPITPFPTLFNTPVYRAQVNMIEMMAANFFYTDPKTKAQTPLDVYIGNMGPLRLRIYNHSPLALDGRFDPTQPFIAVPPAPNQPPGAPVMDPKVQETSADPVLSLPARHLHALICVETPLIQDIVQAMREDSIAQDPDMQEEGGRRTYLSDIQDLVGRSLPLLFIRSYDGVGYHSGRVVALEHIFAGGEGQHRDFAAEMAKARVDPTSTGGWTIKVL